MKNRTKQMADCFFKDHGDLLFMKDNIMAACKLMLDAYHKGGKLLICGNGGSSSDSDHIVGELMKGFLLKRPLDNEIKEKFKEYFGNEGGNIAEKLQGSLPAISLSSHSAFCTAYANDVDASLYFAQQVIGYGKSEDLVLGISTSGNAKNVYYALMSAKVKGMKCIVLSGGNGGKLASLADCLLIVPAGETYKIQEFHLVIYHFLCAFVESEMFEF